MYKSGKIKDNLGKTNGEDFYRGGGGGRGKG